MMKNAWLGSVTGIVLGGAAVWGYLGYSGQSTATVKFNNPKPHSNHLNQKNLVSLVKTWWMHV